MRRRHARWCLQLVEEAWPAFATRIGQDIWLERIELEHDNLRKVIAWLKETGDTIAALHIASRLFWFWHIRGHLSEGRRWLERLLVQANDAPVALRGRGLLGLGMLAHWQGDDERATPCLEEGPELSRAVDDGWAIAFATGILGIVAEDAGNFETAYPLQLEALERSQLLGDTSNAALVQAHLGVIAWGSGDIMLASRRWQEALDAQRSIGESLATRWELRTQEVIAHGISNFAVLAASSGQHATAARLFGAAEAAREIIGLRLHEPEKTTYARSEEAARIGLSRDMFDLCWSEGRKLNLEQAVAEAMATQANSTFRASTDHAERNLTTLTARELEVLHLLVLGRTDREIATALFVSPRTAHGHVAKIFSKLEVKTRTAAVTTAIAAAIVPAPHSAQTGDPNT